MAESLVDAPARGAGEETRASSTLALDTVTKRCRHCGDPKPLNDFYPRRKGKEARRGECIECSSTLGKTFYADTRNQRNRDGRKLDPAKYVLFDARGSDRKRGRTFALTIETIRELLAQACTYCGTRELRMTLDRIDNAVGHVPNNVVPACIRCNYVRRDMPYEAWLCLLPGLREATVRGLFGSWTAATTHRS